MKSDSYPSRYRLLIALASLPLFGRLATPLIDLLIERQLQRLIAARPHPNLLANLTRAIRGVGTARFVDPSPSRLFTVPAPVILGDAQPPSGDSIILLVQDARLKREIRAGARVIVMLD